MRVLLIGSGGREHALAWKLTQSPKLSKLYWMPGSDAVEAERWPLLAWPLAAQKAVDEKIDLVVIGPDNALAEGASDAFLEKGIPSFGPTQAAARLESSKAFCKSVMIQAGVPTAKYVVIKSVGELKESDWSQGGVVKADGLALGKGVRVCDTFVEMLEAADALFQISPSLVVEEKLRGEELSWMGFCDGERFALLEPARDYKRLRESNQGPNTGGMGAISPVPGIPGNWKKRIGDEIFGPMLREMKKRGSPFRGLLYAGLMVDVARDQIHVLEFNARFGDPEAQVLLPRIKEDLLPWLWNSANGKLELGKEPEFSTEVAVYVVGAASGYPESPQKGDSISMRAARLMDKNPKSFFAGVSQRDGGFLTSGGRVLGGLGMAKDLQTARECAYDNLKELAFEGMQFRKDIGL